MIQESILPKKFTKIEPKVSEKPVNFSSPFLVFVSLSSCITATTDCGLFEEMDYFLLAISELLEPLYTVGIKTVLIKKGLHKTFSLHMNKKSTEGKTKELNLKLEMS